MGNHEFCEMCHENDFHRHRPCDPEKVKKVQEEKKRAGSAHIKAKEKATQFAKELKARFKHVDIDSSGNVVVPWYSFIEF